MFEGCTSTLTIYGVARGLGDGLAARLGSVPKRCQNSYPGRLVFSLLRRGSMGGVPKVGVVFQQVVPESSLGILLH